MNLERRFHIVLSGYTLVLLILSSALIFGALRLTEDALLEERVRDESRRIHTILSLGKLHPKDIYLPPGLSFSLGEKDLSPQLQSLVKELEAGTYEFDSSFDGHIAISTLKNQRLYVLIDSERFEVVDNWERAAFTMMLAFSALFIILALFMGTKAASLFLAPIKKLAHQVETTSPKELKKLRHSDFPEDEFTPLVQALNEAFTRIELFIDREKEFTRHASHELRSPLAVIKGALEVIEAAKDQEQKQEHSAQLRRVSRAVKDMEYLIETFLTLAREEELQESGNCTLTDVVKRAIENNRYLLKSRENDLSLNLPEAECTLPFPQTIVYIAVANLIRNAIMHTTEGKIEITVQSSLFSIKDCGEGISKEQLIALDIPFTSRGKSTGLGLSIVSRLAKSNGWQLSFDQDDDCGSLVQLDFKDKQ